MNTDFENLKSQWQSLNKPTKPKAPSDNMKATFDNARLVSAPDKIAAIYRRLIILCLLWIPLSLMLCRSHIVPLWLGVTMAMYFGAMSLLNTWILTITKSINFSEMTMIEALQTVCKLQRSRTLGKMAGTIMYVPLVTMMILSFAEQSQAMLVSGIIGAIIGVVIGLSIDSRIRAQIKIMRRILEEATA